MPEVTLPKWFSSGFNLKNDLYLPQKGVVVYLENCKTTMENSGVVGDSIDLLNGLIVIFSELHID